VRYNPGIMAGLGAPPEIAAPNRDNQRLTELKEFLAQSANPGNCRRIAEIDAELERIAERLAELGQKGHFRHSRNHMFLDPMLVKLKCDMCLTLATSQHCLNELVVR